MAAVSRNGVIGRDGALPWQLPEDMRFFRETTMGHVLVMGRRTYDSIGRPLPGRTTIVVTRQSGWPGDGDLPAGLVVAGSVSDALTKGAEIDGETFVQGGAGVYAEALSLADTMMLTWVYADYDGDTFFPAVDWSQWDEVDRTPFSGGARSTYRRRTALAI